MKSLQLFLFLVIGSVGLTGSLRAFSFDCGEINEFNNVSGPFVRIVAKGLEHSGSKWELASAGVRGTKYSIMESIQTETALVFRRINGDKEQKNEDIKYFLQVQENLDITLKDSARSLVESVVNDISSVDRIQLNQCFNKLFNEN